MEGRAGEKVCSSRERRASLLDSVSTEALISASTASSAVLLTAIEALIALKR